MTELLPLMSYCLLMSITPGPNNVLVTASGANFGYRGTLPQILGINIGGFVQTGITCLGLGTLFTSLPMAQTVLQVAGALYMIFLAWKLANASVGDAQLTKPVSFLQGALLQAVNPKNWIKSITLASVFMPAGMDTFLAAFIVAGIGLVIGFPCISMWALGGIAIRRFLTNPRKQRAFNLLMAGLLLAMAISFLR